MERCDTQLTLSAAMSSLRNSLHRRNHKERSQLSHRTKFGQLEKHKDYVLRAKDFHSKQQRIQRLREKAAFRNKDEFYFAMIRSKTEGGVHVQGRGNVALPMDIVKVLKTQDENYVRTTRAAERKRIDALKAELAQTDVTDFSRLEGALNDEEWDLLRQGGVITADTQSSAPRMTPNRTVFVDDDTEAQRIEKGLKKRKPSLPSAPEPSTSQEPSLIELGWKANKSPKRKGKSKMISASHIDAVESVSDAERLTRQTKILKELAARLFRAKMLRYAARELEMQRLMAGKGTHRKIHGAEPVNGDKEDGDSEDDDGSKSSMLDRSDEKHYRPRVYRWKAERKK